ncbi:hypothetical protein CMV30_06485 [Nibricoccus aquaticus]|uniref:YMGG-like Gly-zipper domain-containing protein n=1 Tax=Nibricoccus aquaticus TaxID=2576891 RepID=A0A290Q4L3_9BACT|nr:YMGG-like glycine zipper-containing protein [Nibricoccus aquaticus]ATC63625.1 hypothetical protein CMV30_06485 [Nibricoccus aquaticus]
MKTTVVLLALVAVTQTAHAQYIRSETAGGALLGGIAGGIIGHNSGHDAWKGAAIGTVVGGLLGSSVSRESREIPMPSYRNGYGRDYGYYTPSYASYRSPLYHSDYSRSREPGYYGSSYTPYASTRSRASTGLLLGGIAGAVIGNNSGDLRNNPWRGAAIGATTGWLLGSIADQRARERARAAEITYVSTAAPEETPPATPAQTVPQTVIINNNYYGNSSAMAPANSLFGR